MRAMNKLIFLDFDGVLHPTSASKDKYFCNADKLLQVIKDKSCRIVISSSWRFSHSLTKIKTLLPQFLAEKIIGVTGNAYIGKHARFNEIQIYLNSSSSNFDWIALDDSKFEFPENCSQLIHCNPNFGITDEELIQIEKFLNEKDKSFLCRTN
jgi:hypothetical protein